MGRFLAIVMLSSVTFAQLSFAANSGQITATPPVTQPVTPPTSNTPILPPSGPINAGAHPAPDPKAVTPAVPDDSDSEPNVLSVLPPMAPTPPGKATVIGGSIRNVDPVRDQFTLKVFGGPSMKILFDARTEVYRDGVKTPLKDLHSNEHASVETVLDGTTVFARSIHMLSQAPEGDTQGQVLSFDPGSGELTLSNTLSRQPIKIVVPQGTPVDRVGQGASPSENLGSSAVVPGALVSVKFVSDNTGRGVASKISILAVPGAAFKFSGNITYLDLHTYQLTLVDPTDNSSYTIFFNPAGFPVSRDLHEGSRVRVTASFDGTRYVASAITVY